MQIPFNVLDRVFQQHQVEYEAAALKVLRSGWYVLGQEVDAFEKEFAAAFHASYCVAVNSGLDALTLALRALEIGSGDEVIVPANTYIASVLAITENRATPVFVEPDIFYNLAADQLDRIVTEKTKAVLAVHLYGQACNMEKICRFVNQHGLFLVEDCAQSHTACYNGKMTGTFGTVGCYSFFPTKNLGAFGDGGAVVTEDVEIAQKIKMMRNYGSRQKYVNEILGINSRMDELQAALLRIRLNYLHEIIAERQTIAARYLSGISHPGLELPRIAEKSGHVWHLFVIRTQQRHQLQKYLLEHGIQTQIHYPIPPHLAGCYSGLGYRQGSFPIAEAYANTLLSLPLYNGMTKEEIDYVIDRVNHF